jgi:predicted secreted protein
MSKGRVSMRSAFLLTKVGIIVALVVLGCAAKQSPAIPQGSQTKTVDVGYVDLQSQRFITRDITLAVGDALRVTLASNASTGFRWTAQAQIGDSAVVQQTGHESVGPAAAQPGASGTEVWTFKAVKAGTTTISTDYNQPWPGGTKGAWTFKANISVQ